MCAMLMVMPRCFSSGQDLGDGSRERRLAVVDVADGADVDVRLGALELGLRHGCSS
jgi:hypothetical protein